MHKDIWGYALLAFLAWVVITANAMTRIERACAPVGWGSNVLTSLTSLALPSQQKTLQEWGERLEYGCRFTIWRLAYQRDYNEYLAGGGEPVGKSEENAGVTVPPEGDALPAQDVAPALTPDNAQEPARQ